MTFGLRNKKLRWLAVGLALFLLPAVVLAANRRSKTPKMGEFNPDHETIEMFDAIENGQIRATVIPKDSTLCRVMIENKSDRPLNVKLPEAFAGVPVLAQRVGGDQFNGGSTGQTFGGGFGGGGFGRGIGGVLNVPAEKLPEAADAAFLNVAPEKVGKRRVTIVCLEHGKPDPRPAMKYEIKPLAAVTDRPAVYELCRLLGTGKISQRAAQAAAWHLNNDMTWLELAAKVVRHVNGNTEPYFSRQEIQAGMQIGAVASKLAEQRQQSSSESDSLSQTPSKL
jgi:hypothetical protein